MSQFKRLRLGLRPARRFCSRRLSRGSDEEHLADYDFAEYDTVMEGYYAKPASMLVERPISQDARGARSA